MTATQDMKPADVMALVRKGVSTAQLDSITQQVLMMKSARQDLQDLRCTLADIWKSQKGYAKAAHLYRRIQQKNEDWIPYRLLEAECLIATGQAAIALKALDEIPQASKENNDTVNELYGHAYEMLERYDEAVACFRQVVESGRIRNSTFQQLVRLLIKLDRATEAEDLLRAALRDQPHLPALLHLLSRARHQLGHLERAEEAIRQALAIEPDNPQYLFNRANILQALGRLEEAEAIAEHGLQMDRKSIQGLGLFGSIHKYEAASPEYGRLEEAMAEIVELSSERQVPLLYTKAKALEDIGHVSAAFANYAVAGRIKLRETPFAGHDDEKFLNRMKSIFTSDYLGQDRSDRCQACSPIFVVGMPRSGTSLLEQVLSSHSQIAGIGEQKIIPRLHNGVVYAGRLEIRTGAQPYWPLGEEHSMRERGELYIQEAAKAARVPHSLTLDKMPPNYRHVGFIFDILPNAKVIHSMRHPVETCVSCYRTLFQEGHAWSYDLTYLAEHYRFYFNVVKFWDEMFPGRILHVRYEDMVDDLENQTRRLLDYLGLAFEEQCLNFHENPNPMRTASVLQVRQPLYRSSRDRWQKHRELLTPLYHGLADIIESYQARTGLFAKGG
jgi:tetratricopeptide (TPR) repeat protein